MKVRGEANALQKPKLSQILLAGGLADSHERFIAWGIRLPIQDNVCTTGKPNQWQRPIPWIIMKPVVALRL